MLQENAWSKVKGRRKAFAFGLLAAVVLGAMVVWYVALPVPLAGWSAQLAVFTHNYERFGLWDNRLLPAFNVAQQPGPVPAYLSKPPLVPLLTFGAVQLFGHSQSVFNMTLVLLTGLLFLSLWAFTYRRWGFAVACWALALVSVSGYALMYGDTQTFEPTAVLGMNVAIFAYFAWRERDDRRWLFVSAAGYLFGLAADYLAFFAAAAIVLHALISGKKWRLPLLIYPALTIVFVALMVGLMLDGGNTLGAWLARAGVRSTSSVALDDWLLSLAIYPTKWLGIATVFGFCLYLWLSARGALTFSAGSFPLVATLLLAGVGPLLFFGEAYVTHRYWVVFILPALVAGSSIALEEVRRKLSPRSRANLATVLFLFLLLSGAAVQGVRLAEIRIDRRSHPRLTLASALRETADVAGPGAIVGEADGAHLTALYYRKQPVYRLSVDGVDAAPTCFPIIVASSEEARRAVEERYQEAEVLYRNDWYRVYRVRCDS